MLPPINSRRAEEFDSLLEGDTATRSADTDELLALVGALRAVPAPEARPDFVASLRTQLVAAAEREPARADAEIAQLLTPRQRRGSRERRLAALVGGFAVVSATGSMAVASQGALPGDALYPIKRAIEDARTSFQGDDAGKADTMIAHARARLAEVQQLLDDDSSASDISTTLQDFTEQIGKAGSLAIADYDDTGSPEAVASLRGFTAESMKTLGALGPDVPEASRPMLITASQTVRQVDAAAWEACASCADGSIIDLPDWAMVKLSEVLKGDVPGTASVTETGPKPAVPTKPAKPAPSAPAPSAGTDEGAPSSPAPSQGGTGGTGGVVGDTVDKVGDVVGGITGGSTPKPSPSPSSTSGDTLLGGVGGLLGGLLGR